MFSALLILAYFKMALKYPIWMPAAQSPLQNFFAGLILTFETVCDDPGTALKNLNDVLVQIIVNCPDFISNNYKLSFSFI